MVATLIDSDVVGFADGNAGHVYNFPAGAPSVNDLDILCINSNTVVTTPTGFTLRVNATNNQGAYIYSRKAVGGEGSSVTITTSGDHNTVLTWSRWSGTDAFSAGSFQRADNTNGTVLPATTTGALAATGMLVVAYGALHNFDGAVPTSPIWINSWTAMEAGSQGGPASSSAAAAFTAYKTNAGTASETIDSVSWTNAARNRYALWVAFTSDSAGPQNLEPTGIASAEAFGTPTIQAGEVTISPTGIGSGETFGTPTIQAGAVSVSPTGIVSAEAFGTPTISASSDISPTGIGSGEAFGTPSLLATNDISPTGIGSGMVFGTPTIVAGDVTLSPTGIGSGEAFGTPTVAHGDVSQEIMPVGIPSKEAFGEPTVFHRSERDCGCALLVGD